MTFNDKVTILIASSRSYASLARAVHTINENLYDQDSDKIIFKDVYTNDGDLHHFEITGTPLDLFQVGLRYGGYDEAKREKLAI